MCNCFPWHAKATRRSRLAKKSQFKHGAFCLHLKSSISRNFMTVKLTTTISADYSHALLWIILKFNWQETRSNSVFVSNELNFISLGAILFSQLHQTSDALSAVSGKIWICSKHALNVHKYENVRLFTPSACSRI